MKISSTWAAPGLAVVPVLGSVAAVAAVAGLLLAFEAVVRASVAQGESRRQASSEHADALWRCNTQADRTLREACHQALSGGRPRPDAIAGVDAR